MAKNLQIDNAISTIAQPVKDQDGKASALNLSVDKVGIGTNTPQGNLDVKGRIVLNGNEKTQFSASGDTTIFKAGRMVFDLSDRGGGQLHIFNDTNDNSVYLEGFSRDGNGHAATMHITGKDGDRLPHFRVFADLTYLRGNRMIFDLSDRGGGQLHIFNDTNDNSVYLEGFSRDGNDHASEMLITGKDGDRLPRFTVRANTSIFNGDVEVTGDIRLLNADCAENFDISETELVEPGTVMVLGEDSKLIQSHKAYDKCVAGVISGAGDYKPGIVLDKKETGNIRKPIALLGKVFCKVDASFGVIEIGDLLTTSPTPGHAMKAGDPMQAFGTVIGKALRPLAEGQGLIPILIALQ
jgi:hypothetical protein